MGLVKIGKAAEILDVEVTDTRSPWEFAGASRQRAGIGLTRREVAFFKNLLVISIGLAAIAVGLHGLGRRIHPISDVDWGIEVLDQPIMLADGTQERNVYWVVVDGQKLILPPDAVVVEHNRYGRAVVWPIRDIADQLQVRCFMLGTEA